LALPTMYSKADSTGMPVPCEHCGWFRGLSLSVARFRTGRGNKRSKIIRRRGLLGLLFCSVSLLLFFLTPQPSIVSEKDFISSNSRVEQETRIA
jgi:hypothetical protein